MEVRCEDISAGGISFYLEGPPDFTTFVVTLGWPAAEGHFSARVVRVPKASFEGRSGYLIGCRFTGRVWLQSPSPHNDGPAKAPEAFGTSVASRRKA